MNTYRTWVYFGKIYNYLQMKERSSAIHSPWVRVIVFSGYVFCVVLLECCWPPWCSAAELTYPATGCCYPVEIAGGDLADQPVTGNGVRAAVYRQAIHPGMGLFALHRDGWIGLFLSMALLGCGSLLLFANGNLTGWIIPSVLGPSSPDLA